MIFVIFGKFGENIGFAMFVIVQVDYRGRSGHTFWAHSGGDSAVPCRSARHNALKIIENGQKSCKNDEKTFGGDKNLPRPLGTS